MSLAILAEHSGRYLAGTCLKHPMWLHPHVRKPQWIASSCTFFCFVFCFFPTYPVDGMECLGQKAGTLLRHLVVYYETSKVGLFVSSLEAYEALIACFLMGPAILPGARGQQFSSQSGGSGLNVILECNISQENMVPLSSWPLDALLPLSCQP